MTQETVDLKLFEDPYESQPQFTDAKGNQFWIHGRLTDYARRLHPRMAKVQVLYVLDFEKKKSILIVDNGNAWWEGHGLEATLFRIDILNRLKQDQEIGEQ